ncbi:hypothetical protein DEJ30_12085 [Curtobacterium sp. MCPF17_003]|uniref:hypothetical protein n=1 Tax=Curtobacterium sp. MCPF17_003 TaxID=2175637 RepID=UPI000D934E0E|nr:hypothetical protein [Curtobacterium sp. MCPF17_003]PYY63646.1 hypothetical protein DEJ30_12085 [Curtobacterium sp. MCPF17_003]
MSRKRGRERRRILAHLEQTRPSFVEETTPARLLQTTDVDLVIAFRTAGHRLSREPQHRTIGRLVGVRPPDPTSPNRMQLVVRQGVDQASFTVNIGEPITVRRPA